LRTDVLYYGKNLGLWSEHVPGRPVDPIYLELGERPGLTAARSHFAQAPLERERARQGKL
jgi:hypothetical protein